MEEEAGRLLYAVGEGDRGEAAIYCPNLDDMLSPEELSGWVLQHLLGFAQRQLQEAVTGAVGAVDAAAGPGRAERDGTPAAPA